MNEDRYREYIRQKIEDNLEDINFYATAYLDLTKRQIQLGIEWMMALSTLCFAIGGAVVPLITQLSSPNSVNHPKLLIVAAALLISEGSLILLIRKHRIDVESRLVNTITMPHQIALRKTHTVLLDYYQGKVTKDILDKRYDEQLDEAKKIANRPKQIDHAFPELDIYLATMLLGIALIFASFIGSNITMHIYFASLVAVAVGYVLYMVRSYNLNHANILEKEKLEKELEEADNYKVSSKG